MREPDQPVEPWVDPIVAEVRAARMELFAAAGFDLDEFGKQVRARQRESGHEVISLPPRRPRQSGGKAA